MIVFICGAANAGKSTVGKMLAEHLRAPFVEGDDIRKIFYWETVEEVRPEVIATIGAVVQYLYQGHEDVVVAYPIWREDYEPLMAYLKDVKVPIHFVALNPNLERAVVNRGTRELEDWEVTWIKESYARGVNDPPFAKIIDNTNISAQETLQLVLAAIGR